MKTKKFWTMYTQVNMLKVIYHLIALIGILTLSWSMSWFFIALFSYFLFTRIGSDIGFHRYFTHNSFKVSKPVEYLLLAIGTLDCKGSMYSWVISHVAHHAHADKKGDPHSPHRIGFLKVWFIQWEDFPVSKKAIEPYLKDKFFRFTHAYYFAICFSFMVLLGTISLKLLVFGYCIPMVYSIHMTAIINSVGHYLGYRNFQIPDESHNNTIVNLLSLGGGLHNNHHARPGEYSQATNKHWHEFDPAAMVVNMLKLK